MEKNSKFAPAQKAGKEDLERQKTSIVSNSTLKSILDAVPEAVLILNRQRQIVFINDAALGIIDNEKLKKIMGQRVGEMLDCTNSRKTAGGCGTTEACAFCGAVNAILASQAGQSVVEEARITAENGDALDLKVKASPFYDGDELYTVFSITDISEEKRKQILERTFFHDIMNTASGLSGYSELLLYASNEEIEEYKGTIHRLTRNIINEINAQKILIHAENGELETLPDSVNSLNLWQEIVDYYALSSAAEEKNIEILEIAEPVDFVIDKVLLSRVLGNMLKNALEASDSHSTIKVSCRKKGDRVEFSVNNTKVMARDIQMQVFKRSFSTKGKGRGIGTYSMKMLSERYLNGTVTFESTEIDGTTFIATYPLQATVS